MTQKDRKIFCGVNSASLLIIAILAAGAPDAFYTLPLLVKCMLMLWSMLNARAIIKLYAELLREDQRKGH